MIFLYIIEFLLRGRERRLSRWEGASRASLPREPRGNTELHRRRNALSPAPRQLQTTAQIMYTLFFFSAFSFSFFFSSPQHTERIEWWQRWGSCHQKDNEALDYPTYLGFQKSLSSRAELDRPVNELHKGECWRKEVEWIKNQHECLVFFSCFRRRDWKEVWSTFTADIRTWQEKQQDQTGVDSSTSRTEAGRDPRDEGVVLFLRWGRGWKKSILGITNGEQNARGQNRQQREINLRSKSSLPLSRGLSGPRTPRRSRETFPPHLANHTHENNANGKKSKQTR